MVMIKSLSVSWGIKVMVPQLVHDYASYRLLIWAETQMVLFPLFVFAECPFQPLWSVTFTVLYRLLKMGIYSLLVQWDIGFIFPQRGRARVSAGVNQHDFSRTFLIYISWGSAPSILSLQNCNGMNNEDILLNIWRMSILLHFKHRLCTL